tara:strand:- start:9502 stop:10065 length:564 start_codon:yes stop_codon:yes gene_type:complete
MKSPYSFIVRASGGNRYVGSKDIEGVDFIVNTSEENHKASNRIAVVVSTPVNYNGDIQVGDSLVVHHNVFKFYNDMYGRKKSGRSFLKDDLFFVDNSQFYMYGRDGKWFAHDRYCFIKPINKIKKSIDTNDKEEPLMGEMLYPNAYMLSKGVDKGSIVGYKPNCNYEFVIDGERMYRLFDNQISMVL